MNNNMVLTKQEFLEKIENNKLTECFLDNFQLLQKYSDEIISTKEYSNITVPKVFCGFMYSKTRSRPMTLGELLSYHQKNLFVYDCNCECECEESASTPCCKKLYAISIIGSPLSGSTWIKAYCPVCQKIFQKQDCGASIVIKYPKTAQFKYEESPLDILALVGILKEKETNLTK